VGSIVFATFQGRRGPAQSAKGEKKKNGIASGRGKRKKRKKKASSDLNPMD